METAQQQYRAAEVKDVRGSQAMKIESLEAYDVDRDIIDIWRQTVGPTLLPVQEKAVKEYGLLVGGNIIVFSPTSSGKTFIGEMAAVKAARSKTKVFYLVPQKALAEEKFRELSIRYAGAGIDVVVSSRDHREFDERIVTKRFQIAVVVFEKLQALLVSQPSLIKAVGLVVVDELQMITDDERGPSLELLLTKLKTASNRPRILGLSAVLGKPEALATWLDAKLLVDTGRPVELRKGVLCQGVFRYREHNSAREGTEEMMVPPSKDSDEILVSAADWLARRGEQLIVFVPDRARAARLARALAERTRLSAARSATERLRESEETFAREALLGTLENGVAFHHADLTLDERNTVEAGFRAGEIRAIVSTSTLAVGMNLPAKNVLLDGRRWKLLKEYGKWSLEDLSKSEYENISGRAGRLSLTNDFGRSILVTASQFEARVWLQHYVGGDFEEVAPTLKDAPLEDHVLDLVASGMGQSQVQVAELLKASFTGQVYWAKQMGDEGLLRAVEAAIRVCREGGLIRASEGGLTITRLGKICAGRRLGVKTAVSLAAWAKEASQCEIHELEVVTVLTLTLTGSGSYVSMSRQEEMRSDHRGEIMAKAQALGLQDRPAFRKFADDKWAAEYDEAKCCKKAAFLMDWLAEVPTSEIEERYEVWAGALKRVGEEHGWLCQGLAEICQVSQWPAVKARRLKELGERLQFGVRADALSLMRLRVPRLGRGLAGRLRLAGLVEPRAMKAAGAEAVRKGVGRQGVFDALWSRLHVAPARRKEAPGTVSAVMACRLADAPIEDTTAADDHSVPALSISQGNPREPPALVVDLQSRRVIFHGIEIPTTPPNHIKRQALFGLAVLASQPGTPVSDIEIAAGMKKLGVVLKRPVAPDLYDLRYKILQPIRQKTAGTVYVEDAERLVRSVPGGLALDVQGGVELIHQRAGGKEKREKVKKNESESQNKRAGG